MLKIILVIFIAVLTSACSSNNQDTNAFEEYRSERDERREVRELVDEKRESYIAPLEEITFIGNPEDLENITLELNTDRVTLGIPRYYHFIEIKDTIELQVGFYVSTDSHVSGMEWKEEELIVNDMTYDDGTYSIQAEEYTFFLHTFEESIRRLRDDAGEALTPSHYIPAEIVSQWYEEAREELNK